MAAVLEMIKEKKKIQFNNTKKKKNPELTFSLYPIFEINWYGNSILFCNSLFKDIFSPKNIRSNIDFENARTMSYDNCSYRVHRRRKDNEKK